MRVPEALENILIKVLMGLYIAKTIIERFGGSIKAYNLEGSGAGVEFSIKY